MLFVLFYVISIVVCFKIAVSYSKKREECANKNYKRLNDLLKECEELKEMEKRGKVF